MIDLRSKALPEEIIVQGRAYSIYTDFRVWLHFSELIKDQNIPLSEFAFIFKGNVPMCNFAQELMQFYTNPNATPNDTGASSTDTLVDYILDGEYIYASFMKDYNIDLLDVDMHWWKFKALFNSLSEDTKIKQIISYRGYKTPSKNVNIDSENKKLKRMWSLDERITEEEREALERFNNL